MKEKWFVAFNPNSGAGRAKKDEQKIYDALHHAGIDFEHATSLKHRQSIEHVQEAIASGHRKIIAVGGDGTLHHVVNGVMQQEHVSPAEIAVGMISVGTGNDWVRHHNIPTQYDRAIQVLCNGQTTQQDVGILVCGNQEKEYFVNFSGIGFDAYVVEHTVHLKKYGASAYLYGLVQCLFQFDPEQMRIEIEGKEVVNDAVYMIIAGIGKYAGGGMMLAPDACANDGLLDITIGKSLSKSDIILNAAKLFNGKFTSHPKVESFRATNLHVEVLSDAKKRVKAECDGELMTTGPFDVTISDQKIHIYT